MTNDEKQMIHINYVRPKFWHRVIANLIDFLLFALIFGLLFIALRAIVQTTDEYKNNRDELNQIRLDSGLYIDSIDYGIIDVVTFNNRMGDSTTGYAKMANAIDAVDKFLSYVDEVCDEETSNKIQNSYDEARLDTRFVDEFGNPYFIETEDGIVRNENCKATNDEYYKNFYCYYIDEVLQGYLITSILSYLDLTRYMSNLLLFIELPISYLLSGLLVYYVPTFIFKRGRKTIGKAIYHIGLIDSRYLNPTKKRTLARFSIFYFFELILSPFTLGIPLIISFSLMAFTKTRQGFPDYMLGLYEIDTSKNNIYNSYEEIEIAGLDKSKKPIDFKMRDLP